MGSEKIIDVEMSFRLVNLDFDGFDEFQYAENIVLRKLSKDVLDIKYPTKSIIVGISDSEKQSWNNHLIEATIHLRLPESEAKSVNKVVPIHIYENLIVQPFVFSGLLTESVPYATHCFIKLNERKILCSLVYKGYKFVPDKLERHKLEEISNSYKILCDANSDIVLKRALNRYFIALKEDLHNPNLVNSPNWDKIVDYVITLETIFLSTPKDNKSELNYRFKLNGTSLLTDIIGFDKRVIFDVLGKIYEIRSIIVHGGAEGRIIKNIDTIFSKLEISDVSEGNDIGKLMILSNLLESWIRLLIEKLTTIQIEKRPYNIEGGWEDYIWNV